MLAGASVAAALRLALSMLAIQASIGALNDRVDARRDAAAKPRKPIPAGLVSPGVAAWMAGIAGTVGLLASATSGLPVAVVAGIGLGLGYAYDLRLSRGPWSWVPLALALPLVPIHAWLGATGGLLEALPADLVPLYPAAVIAGAALAIANGLVDIDRDARSGRPTAVVALGATRAWALHLGLLVTLAGLAVALAPVVDAPGRPTSPGIDALRALRTWGVALGIAALALGALGLRASRPAIRERGWEIEAVGVAGVGVGWLAGIASVA